jgi:NAD(P)-dependent dehydrogenase (short-subunit alcohol dehydrogenase family)
MTTPSSRSDDLDTRDRWGRSSYAPDVLRGARALVTGGASGIGFAIGQRLQAMGAVLTLVARDRARLDAALGLLADDRNDAIACDVGDAAAVDALFAELMEARRTPDVLVNNAGSATSAAFDAISNELWNETLRVNLSGVFHCTRAALPSLRDRPWGRIVNIASTAGLIGYRNVAAYCAAKHGVIGLTRALALEMARTGVTVNAVCPGYTETEMVRDAIAAIARETGGSKADAREALVRRNPQRRLVAPEEVAATVAWLCLPESQSINGQAIALSGGEVMTG